MKANISHTLVALLALSLAGTTELAQACQSATQEPQSQTQSTTTTPAQDTKTQGTTKTEDTTKPENNASDPNHVPAPSAVLPNAPSATETQDASSNTNQAISTSNQTKDQQPLGAAAAEKGTTRGGAASKPAGTALAGTKQNQSRGLLIKVGAVLAAGAALGTVYALSRGTSPTPPGAVR